MELARPVHRVVDGRVLLDPPERLDQPEQRDAVGNFIDFLTSRPGTCPELLVAPRALKAREDHDHSGAAITYGTHDSLLALLRNHEFLTQEEFLNELRQQRTSEQVTS